MSNYSDALEQQVHQLGIWQTGYGKERARVVSTAMPRPEQSQMMIIEMLRYAQTYFIASDLVAGLTASAESLPDTGIGHDTLPHHTGWIWLERPVTVEGLRLWANPDHEDALLRAIAWTESFTQPGGRVYTNFHGPSDMDRPFGLGIFGFFECGHNDHSPSPELIHFDMWKFGTNLEDPGPDLTHFYDSDKTRMFVLFVRRFFVSFALFAAQRIVTFESLRVERHARKRLERQGWTAEPLVRIVKLRHVDTASGHQSPEPTDWSCQWIVRGHWRQQFYPSKHEIQPIWITPYVKGPEGKPLKPPRATVFAVVR